MLNGHEKDSLLTWKREQSTTEKSSQRRSEPELGPET